MEEKETQNINGHNKLLFDLVHHSGWRIARQILVDKILELQNVAEYVDVIQTGNATKLLREMKANKRSAEILFDFLRQIEGNAEQAVEQKVVNPKSYMYVQED